MPFCLQSFWQAKATDNKRVLELRKMSLTDHKARMR